MNPSLEARLKGIQSILMAHHAAGRYFASATKGNEREILIREFLSKVLPPPFRFGSGTIIDGAGRETGQLDIVVEFPILPSFPTPGAPERLYLADSVAFAIEVKSDLSAQWQEVQDKADQLFPLRRTWISYVGLDDTGAMTVHDPTSSRIPLVAVGYRGYGSLETLNRRIASTEFDKCPDSVLVVESGAYRSRMAGTTEQGIGAAGLFALCLDAAFYARNVIAAHPDLSAYLRPASANPKA